MNPTAILIQRVHAMYNRNTLFLWVLVTLLCVQLVAENAVAGPMVARFKRKIVSFYFHAAC